MIKLTYYIQEGRYKVLCTSSIPLGKVGVISYPSSVEIVSRHPIPIGTYVAIPFKAIDVVSGNTIDYCAIGVISQTSYRRLVPTSPSTTASEGIGLEDDMLRYAPSLARIIALVSIDNEGKPMIKMPNIPPPPDAQVYLAHTEILSMLFSSRKEGSIKIGHLLTEPRVEIYVDLNALVKHLFITGTTGSGKSNTVAILADRMASYGGTVVIYDVHGEYGSLTPSSNIDIINIDYKINPLEVPPKVLARMIVPEGGATVQRMLVSKAMAEAQKLFKELVKEHGISDKVIESIYSNASFSKQELSELLESLETEAGEIDTETKLIYLFRYIVKNFIEKKYVRSRDKELYRESSLKASSKVDEFFENAALSLKTQQISNLIAPSRIIVLNVSLLSDDQKDYVLKIVLDELLWLSKHNYFIGKPCPIVVFIEEAHIFLSASRPTASRYSIERIAREGRKFGLILGLISQRPRNIDLNTLSQIQNFVFMKLVQEADQQSVMNASDLLTEDLARSLASMATGEALIIGEWIGRFPVFVKIDKHEGKKVGTSLDIVSIWRNNMRLRYTREESSSMLREAEKEFYEIFS
ncbi:MAG: ATP-binding protein [Ignisphaera sp.]